MFSGGSWALWDTCFSKVHFLRKTWEDTNRFWPFIFETIFKGSFLCRIGIFWGSLCSCIFLGILAPGGFHGSWWLLVAPGGSWWLLWLLWLLAPMVHRSMLCIRYTSSIIVSSIYLSIYPSIHPSSYICVYIYIYISLASWWPFPL